MTVGGRVRLSVHSWAGELPDEGDFIVSTGGSCYRIEEIRSTRPGSKAIATVICTRLERGSVEVGQPGVHLWKWAKR